MTVVSPAQGTANKTASRKDFNILVSDLLNEVTYENSNDPIKWIIDHIQNGAEIASNIISQRPGNYFRNANYRNGFGYNYGNGYRQPIAAFVENGFIKRDHILTKTELGRILPDIGPYGYFQNRSLQLKLSDKLNLTKLYSLTLYLREKIAFARPSEGFEKRISILENDLKNLESQNNQKNSNSIDFIKRELLFLRDANATLDGLSTVSTWFEKNYPNIVSPKPNKIAHPAQKWRRNHSIK